MYTDMNPTIQLYNTFRNRWVGAYLADKGIKVIPTVSWGLENTFDFCFNGIEKGSVVAVSTYMVSEHGNHRDQKEFFMKGYNEMLRRVEPELVICYNTPFPEMTGNILFVDYDLSSWRHYDDDSDKSLEDNICPDVYIKTVYGYVPSFVYKGIGYSHGGKWQPKNEAAKRFIGEPNSINRYTKSNGEVFETKIDENGFAVKERHYTTHNREHTGHTNPHDHIITWDERGPFPGPPINYPNGNIPEFKRFERRKMMHIFENKEELQFESISDFKFCVSRGGEVQFDWKDKSYGIGHDENSIVFYEAMKSETEIEFESVEELLDTIIEGQKLREIIKEIDVTERTI